MGQKVHPIGMRVGIIRDWDAKWYAEKEYADYLHEDLAIRKFIQKELADAAVSTIEIERAVNKVNVSLHTAKPGMVIGKGGANVDALRAALNKLTGKQVHINIIEIKRPDLDAHLVGEGIARQLEQRVAFRRAQKQAIQRAMRAGAKGIKTQVSGRLNGAEILPVQKDTLKELFHSTHFALISITLGKKQTLLTVNLVLKYGSTVVKFFQLVKTLKEVNNQC